MAHAYCAQYPLPTSSATDMAYLESLVEKNQEIVTELLPRQRRQRNLARRRDKVKNACVPMRRLSVKGFYNLCCLPNQTS